MLLLVPFRRNRPPLRLGAEGQLLLDIAVTSSGGDRGPTLRRCQHEPIRTNVGDAFWWLL
jgi:hypothetical protein